MPPGYSGSVAAGGAEDVDDDGVLTLTLDRPDTLNSLTFAVYGQLERLFRELPASLATARDEAEQQFRLRELLVAATGDAAVRELVFHEAASWGRAVDERIARVVAAHHLEPLQVSDLAELCAMSLSSFKRHFRALYATSPGRWLTQARLKHARSLVLNSDASVAEICRSSGYGDVSNFIRAFRTEYGTTPTALRH